MISITLESVDRVGVEDEWNFSNDTEFTMHSIHTYPAKFPSFIAKKAFDYAEAEGVSDIVGWRCTGYAELFV